MSIELLKTEENELAANLSKARREIDQLLDMARLVAQLRYESYRAHIDAGFTPDQALELCKKWA